MTKPGVALNPASLLSLARPTSRACVEMRTVPLNLRLALLGPSGASVATTSTNAFGQFHFSNVGAGPFRVQIEASNFQPGFSGTFWLGPQSLTPTGNLSQNAQALLRDISMILASLWIWAGFTMVVVAAGLAVTSKHDAAAPGRI